MPRPKHIVLLLLLGVQPVFGLLTPPIANNRSARGVRISFGPVLGFYTANNHHASSPAPRMSALFSFKKERRIDRNFKTFFHYGIDYFFHGLSFNSYYFKPDSLQLYDKSFGYKYSVFIHEINVPLQFKYSFNRENNSLFSGYFMIGYHLRCLLPGNLKVTQNGKNIVSDSYEMRFRTPFIFNQLNSLVSVSLGAQRNQTAAGRQTYFVELSYRYGFSQYYFTKSYAASSLYLQGSHLALLVGVKF